MPRGVEVRGVETGDRVFRRRLLIVGTSIVASGFSLNRDNTFSIQMRHKDKQEYALQHCKQTCLFRSSATSMLAYLGATKLDRLDLTASRSQSLRNGMDPNSIVLRPL